MKIDKTIRLLEKTAKERGGKFLSKKYINRNTKYQWECSLGHTWLAQASSVIGGKTVFGSWCPYCNSRSRSEELCRAIFEHVFKVEFIKTRPLWIISDKGIRLELDGYNEKLGIAFEYHGPHHTKPIPYYSSDHKSLALRLKEQRRRDSLKRKHCRINGVTLVEIYAKSYLPSVKIFSEFILAECRKLGLNAPQKININKINLKKVWTPKTVQRFTSAKKIASANGGVLLSSAYINSSLPLDWRCKKGHLWSATLARVEDGGWCPDCWSLDRRSRSIENLKKIAKARGGKCRSTNHLGVNTKLYWSCELGHEWVAKPGSILKGRWCPVCAQARRGSSQRSSIKEMKLIAKQHGGSCLSKEYINSFKKLNWKCKAGHTWMSTPKVIKSGSWCPVCQGKNKSIEEVKSFAKNLGGNCLSKEYINNRVLLDWKCRKGHAWKAAFTNINRGKWCPVCAVKKRRAALLGDIVDMQKLARSREGYCLSKKYINANSKLKWKCSSGHAWEATPGHVKSGTWCPKCWMLRR